MPADPRRTHRRLAIGTLAATVLALPVAAQAAPTCTTAGTEAACGGRVVAEAERSVSFIQYSSEFADAIRAIERIAPGIVDVTTLDALTGDPGHLSAGGRQIYVLRITDESVPAAGKKQAVASLSVHANESAGREGGIRFAEDLARQWAADATATVHSGDTDLPLAEVLAAVELYLGFTNPDGWAMGDVLDTEHATFARGNSHGVDLNRQFPTTGWTQLDGRPAPLTEPEARGWHAFVSGLDALTTATDIHGELTSATDSFADLMWPAGQWTPRQQAQELQLAQNMTRSIERAFDDHGVVLDQVTPDGAPGPLGTRPATFATAYDIVGYDDSGFMGDYFVSQGAIEIDVENLLSHIVPSNVWFGALEQAHVAAVRGILSSILVEATLTDTVEASLALGDVAVVDDPDLVRSDDGDGFGFDVSALPDALVPQPYAVDRLTYFDDLRRDAGPDSVVDRVSAADIATGAVDLAADYDSVVVSDVAFPSDLDGAAPGQGKAGRSRAPARTRAAYVAALDAFVRGGGQLLLTDAAVSLTADLGLVAADALRDGTSQAGHVEFGELGDHPWEEDLRGLARQTYYEVPLGYPSGSRTRRAPHHGVDTDTWEAAGGVTVGTFEDGASFTTLGALPVGDGKVSIFGAVPPGQSEAEPHLYGLADYAVTVAGGQVLHTVLEHVNHNRFDGHYATVIGSLEEGEVEVGPGFPDIPPGAITAERARSVLTGLWQRLVTTLTAL